MYLFRIDIGAQSGLGHFKRVQSFIKYLNIKDYKIIVNDIRDSKLLINQKNLITLYPKKKKFKSEIDDARYFINFIKRNNKKVYLVKDSYRLGYRWEKKIYRYVKKLIIISDFIEEKHYADYYINHNPRFFRLNEIELNLLKKNNRKKCNFLLGPDYTLFNSKISNKRKEFSSDLLFYNGGSGNLQIYEKIIKKIIKINKSIKIMIIVGLFSNTNERLVKIFKSYNSVNIVKGSLNISNYIKNTKLFISSAGISMFESSFMKTPTLLFKMQRKQNLLDDDYENLGHFFILDKNDLKNTSKVSHLIFLMLKNLGIIKKLMTNSKINLKNIKKKYKEQFKSK